MPSIILPPQETKQWTKPGKGEVFGSLWDLKNIDLESRPGRLRLSERFYRLFDNGDDADFELPVDFLRSNADTTDRWWALVQGGGNGTSVTDGLMFKTSGTDPTLGWAQDAIASTPTAACWDMEIFGQSGGYDRLVVAINQDLSMLNSSWTASWWQTTLGGTALTAAKKHLLHQFLNLLLVTDGNVIHTIDDSLVRVENRIVLPDEYEITWIANDGIRVYIGTRHIRGGIGLIFPWDGTSETYDDPLSPNSYISYAGCADQNGLMHTINGRGQLMAYNGVGFSEVAALPIASSEYLWANVQTNPMMVHHNGMALVGKKIHILLSSTPSGDSGSNMLENMFSGIWVYDPKIGLYPKYSLGQYDGSTNNDWGSAAVWPVGALRQTSENYGRMLAGAFVASDSGSTLVKSMLTSKEKTSTYNRGYIITPQLATKSIRALWKKLELAFRAFDDADDRIVVKYRTSKNPNLYNSREYIDAMGGTWSDTQTFTSTSGVLAYAVAGMEIEIVRGKGAGAMAHISSVNKVGSTYTVVLDEAIPNASGTFSGRLMNWTKLGTISSQSIAQKLYKITKRSKWIQLKIELRGATCESPEIDELLLRLKDLKR